jgi:hypothetical protein
METAPIRTSLGLTLLGSDVPVLMTAQLTYRVDDPYAVEAVFDVGDARSVRWLFSRDLLDEGLVQGVGDGDVHVMPSRDPLGVATVQLQLSSPDGVAVLEAAAEDVLAFLEQCYLLVPPGQETQFLDLDATVERLLQG